MGLGDDLPDGPSGIHSRRTNAKMMKFELGASLEDETDLDMVAMQISKNLHQIDTNILDSQKSRVEIMKELSSVELSDHKPDLEQRLDRFEMSYTLTTVMSYISMEQYSEASREVGRALRIATSLAEETSIARCYYWMGRIELEKRNRPMAYKFFMDARPCFMDEDCFEGQSLDFYLKCSRPGISERHQSTPPVDYPDEVTEDKRGRNDTQHTPNFLSNKRKRKTQLWDLVLRPSHSARHTPKKPTAQSVAWMVKSTEDVLHRNNPLALRPKKGVSSENAQWLKFATPGPRPAQRQSFTFRCYPRGLAPRSRRTDIFSEQPEEHLLSMEEWATLQEKTKDKKVTMGYLARERQKHGKLEKTIGR